MLAPCWKHQISYNREFPKGLDAVLFSAILVPSLLAKISSETVLNNAWMMIGQCVGKKQNIRKKKKKT